MPEDEKTPQEATPQLQVTSINKWNVDSIVFIPSYLIDEGPPRLPKWMFQIRTSAEGGDLLQISSEDLGYDVFDSIIEAAGKAAICLENGVNFNYIP